MTDPPNRFRMIKGDREARESEAVTALVNAILGNGSDARAAALSHRLNRRGRLKAVSLKRDHTQPATHHR